MKKKKNRKTEKAKQRKKRKKERKLIYALENHYSLDFLQLLMARNSNINLALFLSLVCLRNNWAVFLMKKGKNIPQMTLTMKCY